VISRQPRTPSFAGRHGGRSPRRTGPSVAEAMEEQGGLTGHTGRFRSDCFAGAVGEAGLISIRLAYTRKRHIVCMP